MVKVLDREIDASTKQFDNLEQSQEKPFDPGLYVSEKAGKEEVVQAVTSFAKKKSFRNICNIIRKELDALITNEDDTEQDFLDKTHNAVIGVEEDKKYFIDKIEDVLRTKNITSNEFPSFFDSLAEAIFHDVWGLSVLVKWEKEHPQSEGAAIRGTELWIDINGEYVRQPEQFESMEQVERVKRSFTNRNADSVINTQSPELELEQENGNRITMIQKPRSKFFYLMFRRFVVKDMSLEEQASRQTIPHEDIPIFKALSRTKPNMIIAGPVRSAKSTFMKTLIKQREYDNPKIAGLEKHFELNLTDLMPNNLVFELQAKEGDLHSAVPRLLRMEHDFVVVGEIRSKEMEGYMEACERGERGAFSTYHLTDVEQVVPQLARHLLDEYPNRTPELEIERVAKNLDIVITMKPDKHRNLKRVIGVTEVVWDVDGRTSYTTDLIRYSRLTDKYYYSSNISRRLKLLMLEENPEEARNLFKILQEREKESPMEAYHSIVDEV